MKRYIKHYIVITNYIIISLMYITSYIINPAVSFAASKFSFGLLPLQPAIGNKPVRTRDRAYPDDKAYSDKTYPDIVPNLPPYWVLIYKMERFSPVRDQGSLPACVAFALISAMEFTYGETYPDGEIIALAPGYLFCKCKDREGILDCEPAFGTHIYTAIAALKEDGVPLEAYHPYSQIDLCCQNNQCQYNQGQYNQGQYNQGQYNQGQYNQGRDNQGRDNQGRDNQGRDNQGRDNQGRDNQGQSSFFLSSTVTLSCLEDYEKIAAMKSCLYLGQVFVAGIPVFTSWSQDLDNPHVPDPTSSSDTIVDFHALCFVGYQDDINWPGGGYFWFKNSWGAKWGHDGYGKVSYAYMQAFAGEIVMMKRSDLVYYNRPPQLWGLHLDFDNSAKLSLTKDIGEELNFRVMARGENTEDIHHTITYSLISSPDGAENCLDDYGRFRWIPDKPGTYEFTIEAVNSCGLFDRANLIIKVTDKAPDKVLGITPWYLDLLYPPYPYLPIPPRPPIFL